MAKYIDINNTERRAILDKMLRMKQELREKHGEISLCLFRDNKDYIALNDDARRINEVYFGLLTQEGLNLTKRIQERDLDTLLPRLVRDGFKVAIIDLEVTGD